MAAPAPPPLAALHPAAISLALASSDNRIRIWPTTPSSTPAPLFNPAHLAETFSCIAWLVSESGPKRRQPGEAATKHNPELVAVGTANGRIIVWDVRSATVFKILGEDGTGHSGPVNDMCYSSSTNTLFSCSDDRHVIVWNINTGQIIRKLKAERQPVKKIALSKDGSLLASGSTHIKIWDVSSFQVKTKLAGHPTLVGTLKFSPDGKKLLSCSAQDRFLHVWDVDAETTQTEEGTAQPRGFTSDNPPIFADITQRSKRKTQVYDILGVSDGGIVNVWSFNDGDNNVSRTKPDTQIKIIDSAGRSAIFSAQFCQDQHIIIARGTSTKPAFDKVLYIKDGELVKETTITVQETDALTDTKKATKKQTNSVPDQAVSMLGPSNMGGALAEPKMKGVSQETAPVPPSAMNLQQLLDSASAKDATPGSKTGASPSATSLAALLSQGLRMGDKAIVDTVLNCKDPTVINATVTSLPPSSLLPFLEYLMSNFQASPAAALLLVPWMRALLLHRASYFMSVGDMVSRISGLYQHIESRLGVFKKLLKLSGRLHLILSHISKKDSLDIENISNVPVTVYEEEDDSKLTGADEVDTDEEEDEGEGEGDGAEHSSSEGEDNSESDDDSVRDEEAMSE